MRDKQAERRRQSETNRRGKHRHATHFAGLDRKRTRSSGRMAEGVYWWSGREAGSKWLIILVAADGEPEARGRF